MEEGAYNFFIVGSCLLVAGLNADLKYFWRVLSGFMLIGGLLTSFVCLYSKFTKQQMPEPPFFPELNDELLAKRISKRKKKWIAHVIFLLLWIYSWRELFA